jgi:hypothetical protein
VTLAATLAIAGHPFLVGDLLISRARKRADYPAFNTPAHSDINAALSSNSTHIVSGLSRKLALLDGRLAVGWSGNQIAAKAVISDIIRAMECHSFCFDDLVRFLDSIGSEYLGKMELSLCGMMLEGNNIKMFRRDAIHYHADNFGDILAIGSGSAHFIEIASSWPANFDLEGELAVTPGDILGSTACGVASWVGIALGEQMRRSAGLEPHYYGGGFEILFVDQGLIKPIPGMTFLFIDIKKNDKDGFDMVFQSVLKTGYEGDILIIRKLLVTSEPAPNEIYILSPIYRTVGPSEVDKLKKLRIPWESRFTGAYLYFSDAGRVSFIMNYSGRSEPAVRFVETESGVEIALSSTLMEKIRTKAVTIYTG